MRIIKKHGILNSDISKVLADMGHTDQLTIGDCGLPIPSGPAKIDLALKLGVPSFAAVLSEVLKDMAVEKVILASEIKTHNPALYEELARLFAELAIEVEFTAHAAFKAQTANSKAIIRTGEATPYANIILQAAVIF